MDNLHNENEAIDLDIDGEHGENKEDELAQLAQSSPQLLKKCKKGKTPMAKGKKSDRGCRLLLSLTCLLI